MQLSSWYAKHRASPEMLWSEAARHQIIFLEHLGNVCGCTPSVVGTHTSKSILLPVVELRVGDVVLTMRDNFYNYKVSVSSPVPVTVDFLNLFSPAEEIHPVYCEGFPLDRVYGSYAHDQRQFTVELWDKYQVWCFVWLLVNWVKTSKDKPTE